MISAVTLGKMWNYAKRGLKMAPDFALGTGGEVFCNSLKASIKGTKNSAGKYVGGTGYKNLGTKLKDAFKASEAHNKQLIDQEGGFFKAMWKNIQNIFPDAKKAWKVGGETARAAGKNGFWGSLKGVGSSLAGKMPLIGSLVFLATELPNIATATWEGGIVTGAGELVKAGSRAAGSVVGFALGAALCPVCPFVGGIIGGMLGDMLTSFVVGKSYTAQKREMKAQAKEELSQEKGFDTGTTNPLANGGMNVDQYMLYQLQQAYLNNPQMFAQVLAAGGAGIDTKS